MHARIPSEIAQIHIDELLALSPPVKGFASPCASPSPSSPTSAAGSRRPSFVASRRPSLATSRRPSIDSSQASYAPEQDLDTPDELAVRALLLGILHRTIGDYEASRLYLNQSLKGQSEFGEGSQWIPSTTLFESAVLDLLAFEAEQKQNAGNEKGNEKREGSKHLVLDEEKKAWKGVLSEASAKLDQAMSVFQWSSDMAGRLESRISMLRDEIQKKRASLGLNK